MGPVELLLVRHGQSVGNVARERAQAAGAHEMDMDQRDADVELSPLGERQARALGRWLAGLPEEQRPDSVWSSPFVRAARTARIAVAAGSRPELPVRTDERLRDRELGVLYRLTGPGMAARHPEELERWRGMGKLYYRPPGGESWADVALRVRSLLADLDRLEDGRRVLVVCHDAVVYLTRYVCQRLSEAELTEVAHEVVANASVTRLVREPGSEDWRLAVADATGHLADVEAAGEVVDG